jgi:hypothetical protein
MAACLFHADRRLRRDCGERGEGHEQSDNKQLLLGLPEIHARASDQRVITGWLSRTR